MTGCSKDQVKTYLSRRRRAARQAVSLVPDLRTVPLKVVSEEGLEFLTQDFLAYEFVVDHWSAAVRIRAQIELEGQADTVWFSVSRPDLLAQAAEKLLAVLSPESPGPTSGTATPDSGHQTDCTQ